MERPEFWELSPTPGPPVYTFDAACTEKGAAEAVVIYLGEYCYTMRGLEPFSGLYEIMETLPPSGDLQETESVWIQHAKFIPLGYPAFREGLQWEATQALLLDYCNNVQPAACGLNPVADAAAIKEAVLAKGSPEWYPTIYEPSVKKLGYLIQQKRGILVWDGLNAQLPSNLTDIRPQNCYDEPTGLVYYTFFVVPSFTTPTRNEDELNKTTICQPKGVGGALNLQLHLDYYIHSKNDTKLPKPE
jgi:hypothetical protein